MTAMKNYYGSLCTEMYEILHPAAPQDELNFYLSYAQQRQKILEPLCGSGRFLVPFMERGFDICGMDLSKEMLDRLKEKAPDARVELACAEAYDSAERFDYIFISSGSVGLFTDMGVCRNILRKMWELLKEGGRFVFAVDTVACRCPDHEEAGPGLAVKTKEGFDLITRGRDRYDEATHTQYSPCVYELYDGNRLLQSEPMEFQIHLYELGEMEAILAEIGFRQVKVYASYDKKPATSNEEEMFLFECVR